MNPTVDGPVTAPRRRRRSAPIGRLLLWLVTAVAVVGAVVAFGVLLGTSDLLRGVGIGGPTPAPSATEPSPTPWLRTIEPGQLVMGPGSDCAACHLTPDGGIGLRPIPPLGHPVHGWTTCTECHDNDRLVQTAPGHKGIHADQCLVCHKEASEPAPKPQHPSLAGVDCLGCHGTIAPLPSSMVDRPSELCWLCHQGR
jgi:hypothetical protein